MSDLEKKFIKRVRKEIAVRGLTLTSVAEMIGSSRQVLSQILNGKFNSMRADTMLKLAKLLGISLDDIIEIQTPIRIQDAATLPSHMYATDKDGRLYSAPLPRQPSGKTISFKAWKPFQPDELPTDGILLDEEKRLTANLYEHKVPFIHPCSTCGQWHTCPSAYTTDAELCKEHEDMR